MALLDATTQATPEPAKCCPLCPRLVAFREANQAAHPDWFNGAVPSFGPARRAAPHRRPRSRA